MCQLLCGQHWEQQYVSRGHDVAETQAQQLLHKTSTCQNSAENTFCDWSEGQEMSSVTVMLQSCKKSSFAAKILLGINLSSNVHGSQQLLLLAEKLILWWLLHKKGTYFLIWNHFLLQALDFPATKWGNGCYPFSHLGMSPAIGKSSWHLNPLIGKWNQWSTINPLITAINSVWSKPWTDTHPPLQRFRMALCFHSCTQCAHLPQILKSPVG